MTFWGCTLGAQVCHGAPRTPPPVPPTQGLAGSQEGQSRPRRSWLLARTPPTNGVGVRPHQHALRSLAHGGSHEQGCDDMPGAGITILPILDAQLSNANLTHESGAWSDAAEAYARSHWAVARKARVPSLSDRWRAIAPFFVEFAIVLAVVITVLVGIACHALSAVGASRAFFCPSTQAAIRHVALYAVIAQHAGGGGVAPSTACAADEGLERETRGPRSRAHRVAMGGTQRTSSVEQDPAMARRGAARSRDIHHSTCREWRLSMR